jgi:hypothetical protein
MSLRRTSTRALLGHVAIASCFGLGLLGAASAFAETVTFKYTGHGTRYEVPAGVTSVHVVAVGGAGGSGINWPGGGQGGAGGRGAVVSGNVRVEPGEQLYVEVGGNGENETATESGRGGFNGGGSSPNAETGVPGWSGGGGGASDVRTRANAEISWKEIQPSLESRLLSAAGGGGGGDGQCTGGPGGAGGNAEEAGHEGVGCERHGTGGGAATFTKGGAPGSSAAIEANPGVEGALGAGGGTSSGAGGGGGGLYGGGSGGGGWAGGGGGGGSNLIPTGGEAKLAKAGEAPSVTITPLTAPTVTKVTPSSGPVYGGKSVTITGTNFQYVQDVTFGSVAASKYTVNETGTAIIVESPPKEVAGTVDVTVTTPAGTSKTTTKDHYKYLPVITKVEPNTGPAAGEEGVYVSGAGFDGAILEPAYGARFSFGTATTTVSVCESFVCEVITPPHAVGTVGIKITVNGATSAATKADKYTYE